jgi:putative heme transporter
VVELVLIGGLVAAGGAKAQVVAAVLIYRALTWLLPIPVGVGCYLWWRRQSQGSLTTQTPSAVGAGQP